LTPFQTHGYSEKLAAQESNPGPLGLQPESLTTQRQSHLPVMPTNLKLQSYNVSRILDTGRMVSSGILRRVALVRTDVSEELSATKQPTHAAKKYEA
jgi:hypothetical protein